jgi:hypothetical protein
MCLSRQFLVCSTILSKIFKSLVPTARPVEKLSQQDVLSDRRVRGFVGRRVWEIIARVQQTL